MSTKFDGAKAIAYKNAYLAEKEANLSRAGVCEHGVFVGGVMEDFMCGACEDGYRMTPLRAYEWGIAKARADEAEKVAELIEFILKCNTAGLALRNVRKVLAKHFGD